MTQISASSLRTAADRPASRLDDEADREELRERYYGLLQELRVLLPGVQILVAFLLTVPFANGFSNLDETGRLLFGVALVSGVLAIVLFATPTAFHRIGARQSRSERLEWGIRVTRAGLALFATSLLAALAVVTRVVFSNSAAVGVTAAIGATIVGLWVALPRIAGSTPNDPVPD